MASNLYDMINVISHVHASQQLSEWSGYRGSYVVLIRIIVVALFVAVFATFWECLPIA